jgi:hypothetical protein
MFKAALECLRDAAAAMVEQMDYEVSNAEVDRPRPLDADVEDFDHAVENAADARNAYMEAADDGDAQDMVVTWEDREDEEDE